MIYLKVTFPSLVDSSDREVKKVYPDLTDSWLGLDGDGTTGQGLWCEG